MFYLAIITKEEDGFGFVIPDVPGFTAFAETDNFEEAAGIARRVLASHLASVLDAGGGLPKATDIARLRANPDFHEDFEGASAVIMLPAILPAGRTKRVNLTFDENTLDLIDSCASDRQLTRSAFLAEAARQFAEA